MTEPNGFINFNTPEDYLAYQDRLISNWEMYYRYKNLSGGTMLSETYRQTGRTYSAVKCAVELDKRQETKSILFVTYKHTQSDDLRKYHPLIKLLSPEELNKINFISYSNLEKYDIGMKLPYYVIYDHMVFETCIPNIVLRSVLKTQMNEPVQHEKSMTEKEQIQKQILELQKKLDYLEDVEKQPRMNLLQKGKYVAVSFENKTYYRIQGLIPSWYIMSNYPNLTFMIWVDDAKTRQLLEDIYYNDIQGEKEKEETNKIIDRGLENRSVPSII